MKDNRYQYQSWYVKLWRRRYYLTIPYYVLRGKFYHPEESWGLLWSLNIDMAQCKMNWVYNSKELGWDFTNDSEDN